MKRGQLSLAILLLTGYSLIAQVPYLVKDINTGATDANPGEFTPVGDDLYFIARDGSSNHKLWKTKGDSVILVKNRNPAASLRAIRKLTTLKNAVYFSADDGLNGQELWKAEGDTAFMLKDINPTGNSNPENFFVMGDDLYFSAGDGNNGRELWRMHNDSVFQVQEINPGSLGSNPDNFTICGGYLYFTARYYTQTEELWVTDGDTAIQVKGIPYKRFSIPQYFTALGNYLYFNAESPAAGRELWKAIGDTAFLVKDLYSGTGASNPTYLTAVDSTLYFSANDGVTGIELWKLQYDSIQLVENINAGMASSSPYDFTTLDSAVYFVADEGVNVRKLWITYGDTAYKVKVPSTFNAATITQHRVLNNSLYFNVNSPTMGSELWVAIGDSVMLVQDIKPGIKSSNPLELVAAGDVLYFTADDGTHGTELWMVLGNSAYLVKDISAGTTSSLPYYLTGVGGDLYFSADDGIHGRELWKFRMPIITRLKEEACKGYWFETSYLTQSGQYLDSFTTVNNEDSLVILDLTIKTVNTSITRINKGLDAMAKNARYQWIKCNQGNAILTGDTNKVFIATTSGSYAVIVSQNGCIDTSECFEVNTLGIGLQDQIGKLSIYPNPTNDQIIIDSERLPSYLRIYDQLGKACMEPVYNTNQLDIRFLPPGIYQLEIQFGEEVMVKKMVVQ